MWDQGTSGLPKMTDFWKKSEQIYEVALYIIEVSELIII
jgi:hypothetical protein